MNTYLKDIKLLKKLENIKNNIKDSIIIINENSISILNVLITIDAERTFLKIFFKEDNKKNIILTFNVYTNMYKHVFLKEKNKFYNKHQIILQDIIYKLYLENKKMNIILDNNGITFEQTNVINNTIINDNKKAIIKLSKILKYC